MNNPTLRNYQILSLLASASTIAPAYQNTVVIGKDYCRKTGQKGRYKSPKKTHMGERNRKKLLRNC